MTVTTFPLLEKICPLVDLQIHQIAMKKFHYHEIGNFPYNLLITVIKTEKNAKDYFLNVKTEKKTGLEAGHAYIIPCHVPVRYERTPDVTVVTIRFNLNFFYGLDIFEGCPEIEKIHAPEFATLLEKLLDKNICDNADQEEYIKNALTVKNRVTELCLTCWPERLSRMTPNMWKYEKAFIHVEHHGDARLTVAELAEVYGMRQDVFSRSFSRDLGISPKQYIADFLVRKISGYLLTSQLSIKEIAHELNFSSEYYLSRFFKKHTTLPPSEYKAQFNSATKGKTGL